MDTRWIEEIINTERKLTEWGVDYLYYIAHKDNIRGILTHGILCRRMVPPSKHINIADLNVLKIRDNKNDPIFGLPVTCYAPLYFNPQNPMLFVLEKREDLKNKLVIIAINRTILYHPNAIFTDGNASNNPTRFYNRLSDLEELDWDTIMNTNGIPKNQEEKRKRMAEVLIGGMIPPSYIRKLYTNNAKTKNEVHETLHDVLEGGCLLHETVEVMCTDSWFRESDCNENDSENIPFLASDELDDLPF